MARPKKNIDPMLPMSQVRTWLTKMWLVGAGFTAVILVVTSILRGRAEAAREVWSWFLPLVLPTLGLMIGVLGAAALAERKETFVRKSFADIATALSIGYLAILASTILLEPFSPARGAELYSISNYWLGPLQGLVVAALGYLFTSSEAKAPSGAGKAADAT